MVLLVSHGTVLGARPPLARQSNGAHCLVVSEACLPAVAAVWALLRIWRGSGRRSRPVIRRPDCATTSVAIAREREPTPPTWRLVWPTPSVDWTRRRRRSACSRTRWPSGQGVPARRNRVAPMLPTGPPPHPNGAAVHRLLSTSLPALKTRGIVALRSRPPVLKSCSNSALCPPGLPRACSPSRERIVHGLVQTQAHAPPSFPRPGTITAGRTRSRKATVASCPPCSPASRRCDVKTPTASSRSRTTKAWTSVPSANGWNRDSAAQLPRVKAAASRPTCCLPCWTLSLQPDLVC